MEKFICRKPKDVPTSSPCGSEFALHPAEKVKVGAYAGERRELLASPVKLRVIHAS